MDQYAKLVDVMRRALNPEKPLPVISCKVKEITGDSCTVLWGDLELTDVRLKATINGAQDKMMITPKQDSYVLVGSLTGDLKDLCVLKVDEPDAIELKQNDFEVTIDVANNKVGLNAGEISFNNGLNDGLVLLHKLENNLNKIKEFVMAMNTILPNAMGEIVTTTSGTGATAQATYQAAMAAQQINFEDMENMKIKQ